MLTSVLSWVYNQKLNKKHIKVLYLSRTHSQLHQVQNSLRDTCFRPTMAILGSRNHLCIKKELKGLKGDEKT